MDLNYGIRICGTMKNLKDDKMIIGIINNSLGNIGSVSSAFKFYKNDVKLIQYPKELDEVDVIVLAGVGNFERGMITLKELDLLDKLNEEVLINKKPILGICLGMQLFTDISYENGKNKGFGWVEGEVIKIENIDVKVPHIGWEEIKPFDIPLFNNMHYNYFYFMHSYHFIPKDKDLIIATTNYGGLEMVAALRKENIIGVQFHPEKSQGDGLRFFKKLHRGDKMYPRRIIPVFLLKGGRLVKGTNFKNFTDVGDPLSQAMIYDAQGADEIIVLDITASNEGRLIDTRIINNLIKNCRLPIGAGGGIKKLKDAVKCFNAGADKIVVNTSAALNPDLVKELADEFGSQSVVVSLDVMKNSSNNYSVYTNSGKTQTDAELKHLIKELIECGAGELMVTSIDKEGTLSGFDYDLYKDIEKLVSIPLISSGGSGCYDDMVKLFRETSSDACGIGKMLFLRDYDIVRIKSYLKGRKIHLRDA